MFKFILGIILLSGVMTTCFPFTNLIYTDKNLSAHMTFTDNNLSVRSYTNQSLADAIGQHHDAIQIIAPQIYSVNENGTVWGSMSARALRLCKRYHIKVMPLVTNVSFNQDKLHQLLHNPTASNAAISQLITICQKNHYMGIQFDIENININDKVLFTQFIKDAAKEFHQHQLAISIAIVPSLSPPILTSEYDAWYYDNWSGAFDLKALAQACDFVTIMTYDRHTSLTTPGPIAPLPWVTMIIKNALSLAPANKISLGIPFYSGYWVTEARGERFQPREHQINYHSVLTLQQQYKTQAKWDPITATSFATLHHPGDLYTYLYVQDARSVKALLNVAKKMHLRGISAWKLGNEDPKVWPLLVNAHQPPQQTPAP